jgi:hypothetical protein
MTSAVEADFVFSTWLGGAGSWTDPSKWSGGVVPNNTGSTTFRVSIPSGTVSSTAPVSIDTLDVAGWLSKQASLTLTGNAHVDGTVSLANGTVRLGANGTLSGMGLFRIASGGGLLSTASGTLTINAGMTVRGGVASRIGEVDRPLLNRGTIIGAGDYYPGAQCLVQGSTIVNQGIITTPGNSERVTFGGTYTRVDLGTLIGPGLQFAGTLQNAGRTLLIDEDGYYLAGATVMGGTIDVTAGHVLTATYPLGITFDNVTLNGRLNLYNYSWLNIRNGLITGHAEIALVNPAETPCRVISTSPTLTIGPNVYIHGGGGNPNFLGHASGVGDGRSAIVNHGTLRSEYSQYVSAECSLLGTSIFNDGTISIGSTSFMYASQFEYSNPTTITFGAGGVLEIAMSSSPTFGFLRVNGVLDLGSPLDELILSAGPQMQPGTFYRIVTTNLGVLGQFDSFTPGFEVGYTSNEIFARVVPEPAVATIVSVLVLVHRRRRT